MTLVFFLKMLLWLVLNLKGADCSKNVAYVSKVSKRTENTGHSLHNRVVEKTVSSARLLQRPLKKNVSF